MASGLPPITLNTPDHCIADVCIIPIGTGSPSVSTEVAAIQTLLARSGLKYIMHSAGTTIEGSWDEVMRVIGQAHQMLHENNILRVQSDIRVGTRTDKSQTAQQKVDKVHQILQGQGLAQLEGQPEQKKIQG
ncbi:cell wall biogenesis protein-like protein Ecm15 [Ascobolus immersus RN42]|uniref:Cell wall biogenesis protein-like protein Ecm15 n=1 Tax=Ascobolus immersus RN42 TaxID=1160509 RepID=A0A3N4I447_ASCIM|nr:cell wall biogenesis protein-like protein Ecm15 [Ascobolus immersus RN42]